MPLDQNSPSYNASHITTRHSGETCTVKLIDTGTFKGGNWLDLGIDRASTSVCGA